MFALRPSFAGGIRTIFSKESAIFKADDVADSGVNRSIGCIGIREEEGATKADADGTDAMHSSSAAADFFMVMVMVGYLISFVLGTFLWMKMLFFLLQYLLWYSTYCWPATDALNDASESHALLLCTTFTS